MLGLNFLHSIFSFLKIIVTSSELVCVAGAEKEGQKRGEIIREQEARASRLALVARASRSRIISPPFNPISAPATQTKREPIYLVFTGYLCLKKIEIQMLLAIV